MTISSCYIILYVMINYGIIHCLNIFTFFYCTLFLFYFYKTLLYTNTQYTIACFIINKGLYYFYFIKKRIEYYNIKI